MKNLRLIASLWCHYDVILVPNNNQFSLIPFSRFRFLYESNLNELINYSLLRPTGNSWFSGDLKGCKKDLIQINLLTIRS